MGAAPRDRAGEGLVDCDRDAADLAAVHAVEGDQMSGFVGHGDALRHADLVRLADGAFDQDRGLFDGQTLDGEH